MFFIKKKLKRKVVLIYNKEVIVVDLVSIIKQN